MYNLIISELAHQDLEKILLYIVDQLSSPQAARDFLVEVQKCYERLQENPLIYKTSNDISLRAGNYRRALVANYILVYKVDQKKTGCQYSPFFLRQAGLFKTDITRLDFWRVALLLIYGKFFCGIIFNYAGYSLVVAEVC